MYSVIFDLETGGLAEHSPIIQLAAVAINERTWEETASFEMKLKFDPAVCEIGALELNHYDPEVWAREAVAPHRCCQLFADWMKSFASLQMVSKRTGRPYNVAKLIGHNAATFDGPRLRAMFQRCEVFLPADPRIRCTVQQAMGWFDAHGIQPPSYKLTELMRFFGLPVAEDAHDALADVRMTAALLRRLRDPQVPAEAACA
jgi:DNA polymerase III epsilon subunit-like protein